MSGFPATRKALARFISNTVAAHAELDAAEAREATRVAEREELRDVFLGATQEQRTLAVRVHQQRKRIAQLEDIHKEGVDHWYPRIKVLREGRSNAWQAWRHEKARAEAAEARAAVTETALTEIAGVATDLPHARRLDRDRMREIARAALALLDGPEGTR